MNTQTPNRRWLVPEVVQTSEMDCGPAALKCLCEGFGLPISYGRLREACQTDVDGTSIDTLEEVALDLGLEAEQIMVPLDHLLLPQAEALPAIVVTIQPNGATHFVVAWRKHGPLVQLMDPGTGRRWTAGSRFLDEVYMHTHAVAAEFWREWAGSEGLLEPLEGQLTSLGIKKSEVLRLIDHALDDPGWTRLAALEATARLMGDLVRSGGLARGREVAGVLETFCQRAAEQAEAAEPAVPAAYWSVRPGSPAADGEVQLEMRGAVLVRIMGRTESEESPSLSPELEAALRESPSPPERDLWRLLGQDGWLAPAALVAALFLAAGGLAVEALLFRALFDLPGELGLPTQRLGALAALLVFAFALLLLEVAQVAGLLRLGRRLELGLRTAFLTKLPRLHDRYFQSQLVADMAERSHKVHTLRELPEVGGQLLRAVFALLMTAGGIIWLDASSAPWTLLAAGAAVFLPLAAHPLLVERDMRLRSHSGALGRFYLDALLGLVAVRSHSAERAVRREHQGLLVEWVRAGLGLQRGAVAVEALQLCVGFGLAALLLSRHLAQHGESGGVLLLLYWALHLPVLGQDMALLVRQYPELRNTTARLFEPLGAPEAPDEAAISQVDPTAQGGVELVLDEVGVQVAGHTVLEGIDLRVEAGQHVALLGPSGAGKSTLVGLFLGWYRPAVGQVRADGAPLEGARLDALRQQTVWIDPGVQLWNRSLWDNLAYGAPPTAFRTPGTVLEEAELVGVVEHLSAGLQTPLGESGRRLSGGEGQRVRLGRGLLRSDVRLALLDEPFRGLDREKRSAFLERVRRQWHGATLLYITHDVAQAQAFDRVLVLEGGELVEDGDPQVLAQTEDSRFRALLEAETAAQHSGWTRQDWRRMRLEEGRLVEED